MMAEYGPFFFVGSINLVLGVLALVNKGGIVSAAELLFASARGAMRILPIVVSVSATVLIAFGTVILAMGIVLVIGVK